jgi:folylpolyglutamate synthase/dihydropteroate synthase
MNPKLLILIKKTNFNSRSVNDLIIEANNLEIKNKVFNTIIDSIRFASSKNETLSSQKTCLIAGSINLVGEVLAIDNNY